MANYPHPPEKVDVFWFFFTGLFAMLGEITRSLHSGETKPWVNWVSEVLSVGFWGGLSGWLLAYYTPLEAPLLAGISAVIGHYGHRGILAIVKLIIKQISGINLNENGGKDA